MDGVAGGMLVAVTSAIAVVGAYLAIRLASRGEAGDRPGNQTRRLTMIPPGELSSSAFWGSAALPLLAATMTAGAVLFGGVAGAVLVLLIVMAPSILRTPVRVFLTLLATWPIVTRYLAIRLPGPLPDIRYERVLIAGLIVFVLVRAIREGSRLPTLGFWVSAYVLLQIAAVVRSMFGDSIVPPNLSVLLNATILPAAVFWLARALVQHESTRVKVLVSVALACLFVASTGIYERLIGALESPFPVETGTASGLRYLGVPGGRAAGIVGNPAIYGVLMGYGLLITLALWPLAKSALTRLLLGCGAAFFGYAAVVSFTRSAWLAIAVGGLVAGAVSQLYLRSATLVGAMLVSALALVLIFSPAVVLDNEVVQGRLLESSNIIGRSERAAYSWEAFTERPLLGWGPGALDALIEREFPAAGFDSSHNTYLTLMVDFGLVVSLAFAGLILSWARNVIVRMRSTSRTSGDRAFVAAMAGVITMYLVSGLFLEMKWFGYTNAVLWLAAGLIAGPVISHAPGRQTPLADARPG